jgi:hypothetical protein
MTMRLKRFTAVLAGSVAAAVLGVAAASAVTGATKEDAPPSVKAKPGSAKVGARHPDPGGGSPWAVRRYTSTSDAACAEAGRYDGRDFGATDQQGDVENQPADEAGVCSDLTEDPAVIAINQIGARDGQDARTVVFGVAGADVVAVRFAEGAQSRQEIELDGERTFAVVIDGLVDPASLPVELELADGSVVTQTWE